MTRLGASKRFQINSGFVFENMVSKLLLDYKFKLTNIKRINRKEFDIVAIFANKIYNFQCKNIFIDISRVQSNPNAMARLNKRIVSYLKRAYTKEVSREQLILNEVGNLPINHIVVTRFPVITIEKYIINFNKLGEYLYTVVNMPHNGHPAC